MVLTFGQEVMLVDTGKENQFKTVKALLDQLGIRRIDTVFNSHPHSDHLGGLPKLMEAYPIGRVITLFPEDFKDKKQRSVIQAKVMKAARARGIPIVQMKTEDSFALGKAKCTIYQQTEWKLHHNHLSGMLMVEYGDCRMLLTADVIDTAQKVMVGTYGSALKADILKCPHLGLTEMRREFLEAVSPQYAFLTSGSGDCKRTAKQLNKYGIPHDYATWGLLDMAANGQEWHVQIALNEMGEHMKKRLKTR